jgi:hypothetical protein
MKLTGFDLHFDTERNRILILKTPNTDGRAAVIEIKPSKETDTKTLKFALESGHEINIRGYFQIQINKQERV